MAGAPPPAALDRGSVAGEGAPEEAVAERDAAGSDSEQNTLNLVGNRDGSAADGAQKVVDWANFPNWSRLEVDGGNFSLVGNATLADE